MMTSDDDLMAAASTPTEVKAAAAFVALGGLFVALTGLQVISVTWHDEWRNLAPYLFLGMGALMVPTGAILYRGNPKAALLGLLLCTFSMFGTCGWFITTWGSVFSLMNIAAVPMVVIGAVLCGLSIPATRKMAAARERLADEGLNLGF